MKSEAGLSSSEYLESHLETDKLKTVDQLEEYAEPLHNYPIGIESHQLLAKSGEAKVGNFSYEFNLSEINPKDFFLDQEFNISEMMDSSPEGPTDEQAQKMMYRFMLENYDSGSDDRAKILERFNITNSETNQTISVTDMLPEGYRIIHKPKREDNIFLDIKGKNIFIDGNLLNLKTIVDLLHEIGHAEILGSLEGDDKSEMMDAHEKFKEVLICGGDISNETLAIFLRHERDAWAFALNKIRKILEKSGKMSGKPTIVDAVFEYIRQNVLKQNSDQIRQMRTPGFKGLFQEALERKGKADLI